jgi:hypothetical protein
VVVVVVSALETCYVFKLQKSVPDSQYDKLETFCRGEASFAVCFCLVESFHANCAVQ